MHATHGHFLEIPRVPDAEFLQNACTGHHLDPIYTAGIAAILVAFGLFSLGKNFLGNSCNVEIRFAKGSFTIKSVTHAVW